MTHFAKTLGLFCLFCSLYTPVSGQIAKGRISLEAGLNIQINGTSDNGLNLSREFSFQSTDVFRVQLQAGYFLSDHDELGLAGSYNSSDGSFIYNTQSGFGSASSYVYDTRGKGWTAGGYYRRYFRIGEKFFMGPALAVNTGKNTVTESTRNPFSSSSVPVERDFSERSLQVGAGLFVGYLIRPHFGLRMTVGDLHYQRVKSSLSDFVETQFRFDFRSTNFPELSVFAVF